jgi:hypothetical protein
VKSFIIPDGHRPGLPTVEVEEKFAESWLVPEVNYDGLEEMYHRDLGVPQSITPHLQFGNFRKMGFFNYYSKKMSVNPVEASFGHKPHGITQVILHEGAHLADFSVNKLKTRAEVLGNQALFAATLYAGAKGAGDIGLPEIAGTPIGFFGYSRIVGRLAYRYSPMEARARKIQKSQELISKYKDVVFFGKGETAWLT